MVFENVTDNLGFFAVIYSLDKYLLIANILGNILHEEKWTAHILEKQLSNSDNIVFTGWQL